jgi:glycosyltransferase involved in cell wall biosynthesis
MPAVSIILPTYNRADSVTRAVDSVLRQTFKDWELLVIDDGSTDGTAAVIEKIGDDRVVLIRQANRGVSSARNAGLGKSRGEYIAFLDSDDEWLPQNLELKIRYLRDHPGEHVVAAEFIADNRGYRVLGIMNFHRHFCRMAAKIGVTLGGGRDVASDPYLAVYPEKEAIGPWGSGIAAALGSPRAAVYRGDVFRMWRYGYLGWLPSWIITRHALNTVGPFTAHTPNAEDFRFMALVHKHFKANFITIPTAVKYEAGIGNKALAERHLALDMSYAFAVNHIAFFNELFGSMDDAETNGLRGHMHQFAGKSALEIGERAKALHHMKEAKKFDYNRPYANLIIVFLTLLPWGPLNKAIYNGIEFLYYVLVGNVFKLKKALLRR